jgi:opacity protein-like surface antigen
VWPYSAAAAEDPAETDRWSFDIVPYLWLAGYEGSFGLPGAPAAAVEPRTDSTDSFATHISAAAMLTAQVRYRDFGLVFDGAWLQLQTEGDAQPVVYSGSEIQSDIAFGTLELSYRLPRWGNLQTDLLVGARGWYVSNEIEFESGTSPGFTVDDSRTWCDPIIGASLRYDISRRWYAILIGDVGGFGVGSDLTWNAFGGVGFQFADWCSATLGYRFLHLDYDNDDFTMDVNVQGFLLGLGFHF